METENNFKRKRSFLSRFKLITEILAIFIALASWMFSVVDSSNDRKLAAYRKLGDSYVNIMELCLDKRCLDCYDIPNISACTTLSKEDSLDRIHQQKVIYTVIVNHFEQAYKTLRYNNDLWVGWLKYIDSYLKREAFRVNWYDGADTWSVDFQLFMKNEIRYLIDVDLIKVVLKEDSEYLEKNAK